MKTLGALFLFAFLGLLFFGPTVGPKLGVAAVVVYKLFPESLKRKYLR